MSRQTSTRIAIGLTIVLGFGWPRPVVSDQDKGTRPRAPSPATPAASSARDVAILVGVDRYSEESGLVPLRYAARDASDMARSLTNLGYCVYRLVDERATRDNLRRLLNRLSEEQGFNRLVFHYSGHGYSISDANYLALSDIDMSNNTTIMSSGLALSELKDLLRKTKADSRLVLVDACRDRPRRATDRERADEAQDHFLDRETADGLTVIFASEPGRVSYESNKLKNGVFSRFIIDGLCGGAAIGDGEITLNQLIGFVSARMEDWAEQTGQVQRPYITRNDTAGRDLLISTRSATCGPRKCQASQPPYDRTPGEPRVEPAACMTMRYIPAGTYIMGVRGRMSQKDEFPHEVTISRPFWIGEHEVTQQQWQAVMYYNNSDFADCGPDCPVEMVSWYEATEFANKMSYRAGLDPCYWIDDGSVVLKGVDCSGYRLPTEAEWEYAARAGSAGLIYHGNLDGKEFHAPQLGAIAWYGGNSGVAYAGNPCGHWGRREVETYDSCGTHPTGLKRPNAWNLYDMLGNVWEWTQDAATANGRKGRLVFTSVYAPRIVDPVSSSGNLVVRRGGSWYSEARHCRSGNRDYYRPSSTASNLGFRLVLGLQRTDEAYEKRPPDVSCPQIDMGFEK